MEVITILLSLCGAMIGIYFGIKQTGKQRDKINTINNSKL